MLLIIVAPLITTQPQGGPVTEGDNVTLSCNASGNPVPSISWTRNGSLLNSNVPRISFGAERRKLTITSINRADSGEYRCVADSSVGNDTSDAATLDVKCKFKLSVLFFNQYRLGCGKLEFHGFSVCRPDQFPLD